ncbi:hypothetical protein FDP41_005532 [Naegleria fowleri]|uniref:SHSP domain-containing protein n=1 Tax=Naegleria fowleri TaxID=5763 RepID=A0A6A5BN07_NAEFO|nr:uncharacterized protein FDP41_005532 [Naegleria fowleri]KAF0975538.1 hypothetical protein FDP41_005532 [Naegleria fowleri]CAG4718018.1 unnamed protein product [Naegleria fowleri]
MKRLLSSPTFITTTTTNNNKFGNVWAKYGLPLLITTNSLRNSDKQNIREFSGCTISMKKKGHGGAVVKSKKKRIQQSFFVDGDDDFVLFESSSHYDGDIGDESAFFHPMMGMAPDLFDQAFQYDREHQNHDSVAINWHEEKDHHELVITCPGLTKKSAKATFDKSDNSIVIKGKLKPIASHIESVTFHRRVSLPDNVNFNEKPYITDINVERSEYSDHEGICVIIAKTGFESARSHESTSESDNSIDDEINDMFESSQHFSEESEDLPHSHVKAKPKKKSKKSSKSSKKTFDEDFVIDAQFIEKCA